MDERGSKADDGNRRSSPASDRRRGALASSIWSLLEAEDLTRAAYERAVEVRQQRASFPRDSISTVQDEALDDAVVAIEDLLENTAGAIQRVSAIPPGLLRYRGRADGRPPQSL
jgi:hypothetical protein